jgi:hypothetical protein
MPGNVTPARSRKSREATLIGTGPLGLFFAVRTSGEPGAAQTSAVRGGAVP